MIANMIEICKTIGRSKIVYAHGIGYYKFVRNQLHFPQ